MKKKPPTGTATPPPPETPPKSTEPEVVEGTTAELIVIGKKSRPPITKAEMIDMMVEREYARIMHEKVAFDAAYKEWMVESDRLQALAQPSVVEGFLKAIATKGKDLIRANIQSYSTDRWSISLSLNGNASVADVLEEYCDPELLNTIKKHMDNAPKWPEMYTHRLTTAHPADAKFIIRKMITERMRIEKYHVAMEDPRVRGALDEVLDRLRDIRVG